MKNDSSIFTFNFYDETGDILLTGSDFLSYESCMNAITELQKYGIKQEYYRKPNNHDGYFWYNIVNDEEKILCRGRFKSKYSRNKRIELLIKHLANSSIVDRSKLDINEYIIKVNLFMKHTTLEINMLAFMICGAYFVYVLAAYILNGELKLSLMPLSLVIFDIGILIILYSKGYNLEIFRYFSSQYRNLAAFHDPFTFETSYEQGFLSMHDFSLIFINIALFIFFTMTEGYSIVSLIVLAYILVSRLFLAFLRFKFAFELGSERTSFDKEMSSIIENNLRIQKLL